MHQADWIAPRLAPWEDEYTITSVVPAGFEAYARVLHPVETAENGDRLVRWADVAAWSAMPLREDAQFHSIALPPTTPSGPPPYGSQGPQEGSLYLPDAEVLAAIGRDWTATPQDCWFCVWDGFGWDTASTFAALTETGQPPEVIRGAETGPCARPGARGAAGAPAAPGLPPLPRTCGGRRHTRQPGRYLGAVPEHLVARRPRLVRGQRDRPAVDLRRRPLRAYRRDPRRRQDRGAARHRRTTR